MTHSSTTPIIASLVLDYSTYRNYFMFSIFKGKYYKLYQAIFWYGYPLLLLGLLIYLINNLSLYSLHIMVGYWDNNSLFALLFSLGYLLILSIYVYRVYYLLNKPKKLYKEINRTEPSRKKQVIFYDSVIHTEIDNNNIVGQNDMQYHALHNVYETDTMFYLYISSQLAILIRKNHLQGGTPDDLRRLLQAKLEQKQYCRCW